MLEGRKAVAKTFDVTERTVGLWVEDPSFPRREDGKFDVEAIKAWRASKPRVLDQQASQTVQALNIAIKKEALATAKEKRLKAQREREEYEGELLPRRVWEAFAARLLSGVGDWAESLRDVLEPHLNKRAAAKILKVLDDAIRRKRDELAEQLKKPVRES